ncbi:MAG: hypothetical protein NC392_15295 [Roseburia sp.]|nr:hypothetical protein [Roseburia sp.]
MSRELYYECDGRSYDSAICTDLDVTDEDIEELCKQMKEGFSKIRNRSLANAFAYMNLVEAWGSGIPKLIQAMNAYDLREPEFIDMEVAFRINLYRNQNNANATNNATNNANIDRNGVKNSKKNGVKQRT